MQCHDPKIKIHNSPTSSSLLTLFLNRLVAVCSPSAGDGATVSPADADEA